MENKKRKVPEEGPNGVDRWSSNGYGVTIGGKKVTPTEEKPEPKEVDEIEEV